MGLFVLPVWIVTDFVYLLQSLIWYTKQTSFWWISCVHIEKLCSTACFSRCGKNGPWKQMWCQWQATGFQRPRREGDNFDSITINIEKLGEKVHKIFYNGSLGTFIYTLYFACCAWHWFCLFSLAVSWRWSMVSNSWRPVQRQTSTWRMWVQTFSFGVTH